MRQILFTKSRLWHSTIEEKKKDDQSKVVDKLIENNYMLSL